MTDNMFGYQINFGRHHHKKARWKRARARWLKRYAKLCEKIGVQNDLQEAVKPRVSSVEQRCGNCNKVIEMDGWKACPWCGKPIDWESWWSEHEAYRRR